MCLPTLLKTFIFAYIPMVGIIMAFEYYRPATGLLSEWVGFENFSYIFKSADAKIIFSNTIIYNLLFIVTGLIVALILALFMFEMKSRKLLKMSQMFMFFPFFVSWILAGTLVTSLIGTEGLYTNTLKTLFGIDIAFYSEPKYWRFILVFVNIWKNAGVSAVVYYATLLNIDNEILEAAEMDGAGRFCRMFYILMPQITTMALVNTIMNCSNILRADFGLFYYVTRGPVVDLVEKCEVIDTYIYKALLNGRGQYGIGTAVGLLQGVVGLVLTYISNRISRCIDADARLF